MPEFVVSPVLLPLLQAEGQQAPSMIGALLPFVLIIVVMYFLMIRPQQKRQKLHAAMLAAIKQGDDVVTSGGMYGSVAGIDDKDNVIWLKIANEVKVKVERSAIARVISA